MKTRTMIVRIATVMTCCALLAACGMPDPDTPLTRAALKGDAAQVRILLARGADPNEVETHGLTPLVLAARLGHVEVARALLDAGADPDRLDNLRTRSRWTPLMNAAHKGQAGMVRLLLDSGADVNLGSSDGNTALALATTEKGTGIVRMLLDAGANPRAGSRGSAALTEAVAACRIANVKLLLEASPGLKIESGWRGRAAVALARLRGHGEILDLIEQARSRGSADSVPSPAATSPDREGRS